MLIFCVRDLITSLNHIILDTVNFQQSFEYSVVITGIVIDSRKVKPNNLFVAIRGSNADGHSYLGDVDRNGALLAIVETIDNNIALPQIVVNDSKLALGEITKFLQSCWDKPIICITGSNGKTTTKFMLTKILETQGAVLFSPESFNNNIGVPLTMFQANAQHWAGVFEVGTNHPGEIAYLSSLLKSDISILTNVFATHIGNFASVDAIGEEKFNIFNNLKSDGVAIYNYDNDYRQSWAKILNQRKIKQLTFGLDSNADIYADDIHILPFKTVFKLNYKNNKSIPIQLKLLGKHQILNALAASAAALALGIDLNNIQLALESLGPISKRMQSIKLNDNIFIIDDSYNASPASTNAALQFLSLCPGKKIAVFGDMAELGDTATAEHKKIGIDAKNLNVDLLFAIGDLSKYTLQAFYDDECITEQLFDNKKELASTVINHLSELINNNDHATILVKGSNFMRMWEVSQQIAKTYQKN